MAEITLHYFGLNGRGETSRMILHYNGTAFEDKKYTFEEFGEARAAGKFEFGKLPVLQRGDQQMVESYAIEAYLCRRFGYSSNDPYEMYKIESVVSLRNDLANNLSKFAFPQFDLEGLTKWLDENLKNWLTWFESRLTSNNGGDGFFVGTGPTHADFSVFQYFFDYFYSKPHAWEKYESFFDEVSPKLKAFIIRFPDTSETLKAYIDQKDKTLSL